MESQFGWTLLSKEDLKRAETQLREDVEGVRDEIGFLALHQAYADRFFPGTSVLHTRLRYVLFIPWIYLAVMERGEQGRVADAVRKRETRLVGRLRAANETGIIGGRTYPQPSTQPPSMAYWSALGAWGLLRRLPDGSLPSRATLERIISRRTAGGRLHDDEHLRLEEPDLVFANLPTPPAEWTNESQPINFSLPRDERSFLAKQFIAVERPGEAGTPSLLARLVDSGVPLASGTEMWTGKIACVADATDRGALVRARQAASLAAIGRAIYAAMVEDLRDKADQRSTDTIHRDRLAEVVAEHRAEALELDIESVRRDAPNINERIIRVLSETQDWLRRSTQSWMDLHPLYENAERSRKGRRARLPINLYGREKRAEWTPEGHALATPLHYRWEYVRGLLLDLQGQR